MSTQPIEIYQSDAEVGGLKLYRPPAQVLAEAREAAIVLRQAIEASKNPPIKFGDSEHLRHEHWTLLGHFYGYSTKIEWTRPLKTSDGEIYGFEAAAQLINERTGVVVGRAEAECTYEEENWGDVPEYKWEDTFTATGQKVGCAKIQVGTKDKPTFQLRSMAETRASGQAYRRKLDWIVVLAGYAATPAEEMRSDTTRHSKPDLPEKLERKAEAPITPDYSRNENSKPPVSASPQSERIITGQQSRRFYAIWKQSGKSREQVTTYLREVIGVDSDKLIPVSLYNKACAWAGAR